MPKIAVLTNDLQYELVEKNQERINAVNEVKDTFCNFLSEIRAKGHIVIHLQLINHEDDPNAERYDGYLPVQKGTRGAEILEEFVHESDIIMEKNKDSGFYETDLDEVLKQHGVDTVIVTGMQTQICVQTTAADAFFRGYNIWVPEDGVVSANPDDKKRSLDWLGGYCATISSTDEIISVLNEKNYLPRKEIYIP